MAAVLDTTGNRDALRSIRDPSVGLWLLVTAAMIALMVVVGGLTRLTESGLSITEWRPVTGMLPPLTAEAWEAEFTKYRGTTQYEILNQGMGLAAFKSIYWWEWGHRFLGRIIGFVFFILFVYFLTKKRVTGALATRLGIIFLLGGAQGALGWWMVKSGLADRVSVSHYRLAVHLGLAVLLFGYVLCTAFEVLGLRRTATTTLGRYRVWALVLAVLVFLQILLGALVAGLDAGTAFVTWPSYGGYAIPPGLYDLEPWWRNHFDNHALTHFQHRNIAYLIVALAIVLFVRIWNTQPDKPAKIAAFHVLIIATAQGLFGVATVISSVAIGFAAIHQFFALALFGSSLWLAWVLGPRTP
jgi:cytochrome c oxidase assembly protein subunit 15